METLILLGLLFQMVTYHPGLLVMEVNSNGATFVVEARDDADRGPWRRLFSMMVLADGSAGPFVDAFAAKGVYVTSGDAGAVLRIRATAVSTPASVQAKCYGDLLTSVTLISTTRDVLQLPGCRR